MYSCYLDACDPALYDDVSGDWKTYFDSCDSGTIDNCDGSMMSLLTTTPVSESIQQYHLGNYYNWSASIATNDSSNYWVLNNDQAYYENLEVDQSICPVGWTLPKASNSIDNGSVGYLTEQYNWWPGEYSPNNPIASESPLFLNPAGMWNGSYLNQSFGYLGTYSSPNLCYYDAECVYAEYAPMTISFSMNTATERKYGVSVRCMSRTFPETHTVEVVLWNGVSSITFSDGTNTQTVSKSGDSVQAIVLEHGKEYTITATLDEGYEFKNWETNSGASIADANTNPTTYTVTGYTRIDANAQTQP